MHFKLLNKIWKFLAEFSGVVTTIVMFLILLVYSSNLFINLLQERLILGIALIILLVVSLIFLFYLLKKKIIGLSQKIKEEVVAEKLEEMERISTDAFDIENHIPTQRIFERIEELLIKDANDWSPDAKLGSFNFYLDKTIDEKNTLEFQVMFYSEWKKELLTLYFSKASRGIERVESYSKLEVPFYKVPFWREAIAKAFLKVNSRLPTSFRLIVNSSTDREMGIWFKYREGQVESTIRFNFKDGVLYCKDDSTETPIAPPSPVKQEKKTQTAK